MSRKPGFQTPQEVKDRISVRQKLVQAAKRCPTCGRGGALTFYPDNVRCRYCETEFPHIFARMIGRYPRAYARSPQRYIDRDARQ